MEQVSVEAIRELAQRDAWSQQDVHELQELLFRTNDATRKFRQVLEEMEAANPELKGGVALKIAIARYLLCRFPGALEAMSEATDNKDRRFYSAHCYRAMRQYDKAIEDFERAKARGWDGPEPDVWIIECLALCGQLGEAANQLTSLEKANPELSDVPYLKGLVAELSGQSEEALEQYTKSCDMAPGKPEATFRLAYFLDRNGQEDDAMELYWKSLGAPPVYANALMNLAVLLEDAGEYWEALDCLDRLLAACPGHPRARLFRRDVASSMNMYYDEDQARRVAKRNAVLDIPVTDFELSVRARNCLRKMNIMSLGDLVRTSEPELLGYKNFGETSLKEIRQMLESKGLRLGQALEEDSEFADTLPSVNSVVDPHGAGSISIDQVQFSVRARRVLEQLNIKTLGELANRSEAELLGQKNFGTTSLTEMKEKLDEYGLKFRDSE